MQRTIIGVDLRCVPTDGSAGAGVAHAASAVVAALEKRAMSEGVTIIRLVSRDGQALSRELVARSCDALFVPSGAVSPFVTMPTFPWVHDLDIFDHPEWFPQSRLRRFVTTRLFLRGLKRAPTIFAVSEYTKRAIMRLAKTDDVNVIVTSEGVTIPPPPLETRERRGAIILGTVEPRKNIPMIVSLWSDVCRRVGQTLALTIAGRDGWGNVMIDETKNVIHREHDVSDARADQLLREAKVALVPSLSEGFGRTALEAMARGTPVIASRCGALPEVVGEAGIMVGSTDHHAWIEAIASVFLDAQKWKQLSRAGADRAKLFSWDTVARTILAEMCGR